MKLTLAELLPLRVTMSKLLQERFSERDDIAFVEFAKGDEEILPERSFDELTKEINEIRNDYRKIDYLLTKANVENVIQWEGETLSIVEAIELAKQLRGEAIKLKQYGKQKPIERIRSFHMEEAMFRKALFDTSKIKKRAEKLERKVNKLSMEIEKRNHLAQVNFPEAKKYL